MTALLDRRLVGKTFGGYRLDWVLGQGRFATCYAASTVDGGFVFDAGGEGGRMTAAAFAASRVRSAADGMSPHAGDRKSRVEPCSCGHHVAMKLVEPQTGGLDRNAVWAECAALSMLDHPGVPRWLGIVAEPSISPRSETRRLSPDEKGSESRIGPLVFSKRRAFRACGGECAPRSRRRYFIVESLCAGTSLERRLAEGERFSESDIASIGARLIRLACHCWSRGVVHGDIRPANVLLSNDGEVSLVDFGLARFFDRAAPRGDVLSFAASDLEGIAEVLLFMLYSDTGRIVRFRPGASWREELRVSSAQRAFLDRLFFDPRAFASVEGVAPCFEDAFADGAS